MFSDLENFTYVICMCQFETNLETHKCGYINLVYFDTIFTNIPVTYETLISP